MKKSFSSIRLAVLRWFAGIWRFRTLRLGQLVFADVLPGTVLKRGFYGHELHLDVSRANPQKLLYLEGARFIPERHLLERIAKPGGHVVDVGANIGYYAILLRSLVGTSGRVICFEPDPDNLRELETNISQNAFNNVRIVNSAVGKKDGFVSFSCGLNGHVSSQGKLTVPITKLDSFLDQTVDLLKIDVEGYEGDVLEGSEETIRKWHPAIFLELHPLLETNHSHEDIVRLLKKHYDSIQFYELAEETNLWQKIQCRYFNVGAVRRIVLPTNAISDFMAGRRKRTLWIVCFGNCR